MARSRSFRQVAAAGVLTGLSLLVSVPLSAPAQGAPQEVVLAAVAALRPQLSGGLVALDVSSLCTAQLAQWDCPQPVREALARLRMVPTSRELTYVCPGGARSCRLVGVRHLVVPGTPRIRGASATVAVQLFTAAGPEGGAATAGARRLELTRRGGRWVVR